MNRFVFMVYLWYYKINSLINILCKSKKFKSLMPITPISLGINYDNNNTYNIYYYYFIFLEINKFYFMRFKLSLYLIIPNHNFNFFYLDGLS